MTLNKTVILLTSDEDEQQNVSLGNDRYIIAINGYVVPALALLVILTNAVVIAVLKRQPTYGASQAGLVGIAVSDTLTVALPAPFYFYQYGLGHFTWVYRWCQVNDWIALYLPTISHTASIWLTVALTAQRYMYVCHPFTARRWCTLKNSTVTIIWTYVFAVLIHICRFFVLEYFEDNITDPATNTTTAVCNFYHRHWVNINVYYSTYMWLRIILIQFGPCISLIILNAKILLGLKSVTNKKIQLHNNSGNNQATIKENTRVTIMIIGMAAITLLVEFPAGIIQCLYAYPMMTGKNIIPEETLNSVQIVANLVILFSYPLNFLLYCSMSAEFKATLKQLCFKKRIQNGHSLERTRMSLISVHDAEMQSTM